MCPMMRGPPSTLRRLLSGWRLALSRATAVRWVVAVGIVIASPSLFFGLVLDDHLQRSMALGQSALYDNGPFSLYALVPGDPKQTVNLLAHGLGPWWSDIHARAEFLRPISSSILWFDYRVLRDPIAIHAHSIVWYSAAIALAWALYRRWIGEPWVAGLAALAFAIDPTHGLIVGWIAQRNALVAGVFGLAALLLHDRARREGRPGFDLAASLCLGAGLFSAEVAIGVVPYFVAHAWFLDRRRFRGLLPLLAPVLAWTCVYKVGDYGVHSSWIYVDPLHQPLRFIESIITNGPLLLAAEIGLPGLEFAIFLPTMGKVALSSLAVLLVGTFAMALRRLWARDPTTRFFLVGSALSVIPSCAVLPSGRLLFFTSFGIIGAFAQLFAACSDRAGDRSAWSNVAVRVCSIFHLYAAPFLFVGASFQINLIDRIIGRLSDCVPNVPELDGQRLVVVNPPDATFLGYLIPIRTERGEHAPDRVLGMAAGGRPVELTRTSETSLTLSSPVAFVQPGPDLLLRNATPFEVGYRIAFPDVAIQITRVNADGWPTEATFEFSRPLEHRSLRFMQWKGRTLAPLELPRIGDRIAFAPQRIPVF